MNRKSILVVDDDLETAEIFALLVEQEGAVAFCAASGEEAVGILKEIPCSILVTDLNMPGMDGFELAMAAKEISPDIDIVMITGDISLDVSRLAEQAGIAKVLCKPCSVEEVQDIARGIIP